MGVWVEQVVPRFSRKALGTERHHEIRARVCAGLTGEVVEVGFGSGLNMRHYPGAVHRVTAVEPSDLAWRLSAPEREALPLPVDRAGIDGQRLPFNDASFDSALSTWTLCSIPDPVAALRELRRVLRPGGRLFLVEQRLPTDQAVARPGRATGRRPPPVLRRR